jgi:hypothetical protein
MKSSMLKTGQAFLGILIFSFISALLFSKSTGAPALVILSQGTNHITVAWPNTGSYELLTNSSILSPNWGVYGGAIQSTNGTNRVVVPRLAGSEFFRLMQTGSAAFISPTNISGMAYYWNCNDLPPNSQVNTWTDEVSGAVMTYNDSGAGNGISPVTTSYFPGLYIPQYGGYIAFTDNNLALLSSNFTVWVVMRPNFENYYSVQGIFGNGSVSGINLYGNILGASWGNGEIVSSMVLNYTNAGQFPYGQTYDILDSGGTLYSNGIAMTTGLGQPLNNFQFSSIGSANVNNGFTAEGYIQDIGIWTNRLLTAADATNLDYWYWNYGVTNITNGLAAWWKLNDGDGASAADSWGTNTLYFGGSGNTWTNGPYGNGGGLYFNGNGWLTNVDPNFADNWPAITVSFWVQETGLGGNNYVGSMVEKGINTGYFANNFPGWAIQGDGTSNLYSGAYQSDGTYSETPHNYGAPDYPIVGDSNWHFIVGGYTNVPGSGMTPFIYIDGAQISGGLVASGGPTNISCLNSAIFIGAENVGGGCIGNPAGTIDDLRIYNRVLSLSEVEDLYKWKGQH